MTIDGLIFFLLGFVIGVFMGIFLIALVHTEGDDKND